MLLRLILSLVLVCTTALLLLAASSLWIVFSSRDRVYEDVGIIPVAEVALVLGTSPRVPGGSPNRFFEGRMAAAALLYKSGKVQKLLLSGAQEPFYDEPAAMRSALLARGVASSAIEEDPGGFRTLASIARAKSRFGLDRVIVVSDRFHVYRALFLCKRVGIEAHAFASHIEDAPWRPQIREQFARLRAVVDALLYDWISP